MKSLCDLLITQRVISIAEYISVYYIDAMCSTGHILFKITIKGCFSHVETICVFTKKWLN